MPASLALIMPYLRTVPLLLTLAIFIVLPPQARADIPLIGNNLPHKALFDGDFEDVPGPWRKFNQSPFWTAHHIPGQGEHKMGLSEGKLSGGGNKACHFDSHLLDKNPTYSKPIAGDVLTWKFAARAEYPCEAFVGLSLVFGDHIRTLAERKQVEGGKVENAVFEGTYTITEQDAAEGKFYARLTLHASHQINVYVDYLDLKVLRPESAGPKSLKAEAVENGVQLTWEESTPNTHHNIYRSKDARKNFQLIRRDHQGSTFIDDTTVNGLSNYYFVTQANSSASPVIEFRKVDANPPKPPHEIAAKNGDTTIALSWKPKDKDIASYNILRQEATGQKMSCIARAIKKSIYEDMLPLKGRSNIYAIEAVDHSGNISAPSATVSAKVSAIHGSSFSDLILPIPIHKNLRSDLWGAEGVLPRDPDHGVEHPNWTYWGGKVVKDPADNKYHILIARWPEGDRKGHWAWPYSTVAHVVADKPTGPYHVQAETAYSFKNGLGHNPNIILLNDGRFMLYSLIDWKPVVMTSDTMNGPWNVEGELTVKVDKNKFPDPREYRYSRNLSGVQKKDGSILVVTKAGAMMLSKSGILGPYEVLTKPINDNKTIPPHYRNSNYEDPTMWYDGVQYHMLINAFLDYRAIYLRSPDGINWKYESGLAYTPNSTIYEDGTRNSWYKLERPNVLQDKYGRATHLSLAAIDVVKDDDYGNDKHSAKHLVLPLVIYKRIEMRNKRAHEKSKTIKILVHSEEGFDAQKDIDLPSLRFGASEEVNFGRGSRSVFASAHEKGLLIEFDGTGNGLTKDNFVGKLIGQTTNGELIVGYSRLSAN